MSPWRSIAPLAFVVVGACNRAPSAPSAPPRCRHVPFVAGELRRIFVPSGTRYVNDHSLARAPDGTWHLFGITGESPGDPDAEHAFLHATAPALAGPWTEQPDALVADPARGEQVLWAPHVVATGRGAWSLFYYADRIDDDPMRGVRRADSSDLFHWSRADGRAPGGRDPFVLRDGARWLLFTVGVDDASRGQILLSESRGASFDAWSPAVPVLTDPVPMSPWRRGNVQSPFVVRYDGQYYLFVTRKSPSPIDYVRTNVFCSDDPRRFDWAPIAELRAHAAEIVVEDGRTYMTSCGWTKAIGEENRGLSLAPIEWSEQR